MKLWHHHALFRTYRRWKRRAILEALFFLIYALVFTVTLGRWKPWRRNSLALGYWSELSDLDITLYCSGPSTFPPILRIFWKFFRRYGEWVAHAGPDQRWVTMSNPLELARDPRLEKIFTPVPRKPHHAQCFVFWMRMKSSDSKLQNLAQAPLRTLKWNYHRACLEAATGTYCKEPYPAFVDELGELLAPIPQCEWPVNEATLKPHRWIGQAINDELVTAGLMETQPPALVAVARAQVEWEIWGLLGQIRLSQNYSEVIQHLERLASMFPSHDPIQSSFAGYPAYLAQITSG